jgi:hypothetical protein
MPKEYLTEPWLAVPAFVLANAALGFGLASLSKRDPGAGVPLFIGFALLAASVVALHASLLSMTDAATIAGASLLGIAAVALFRKADVGGAMPGAAVFLTGLMFAGYHYRSEMKPVPWTAFALAAGAPLAAFVALVPPGSRLKGWKLRAVQLALVIPLAAAAAYIAVDAAPYEKEDW